MNETVTNNKLPIWIHLSTAIGAIYIVVFAAAYFSNHMGIVFKIIPVGILIIFAMAVISAMGILKSNPSLANIFSYVIMSITIAFIIMAGGHLVPITYIPPNSKIIATGKVSKVDPISNLGTTSFRLEMDIGTITLNKDIASTGDSLDLTKKTSNDGEVVKHYLCNVHKDCSFVPANEFKKLLSKAT